MGTSAHKALVGMTATTPTAFRTATKPQREALVPFADYLSNYRDRKGKPLSLGTQQTYCRNVLNAMRGARSTDPSRVLVWFDEVRVNPRTAHGTANPILVAVCHYWEHRTGEQLERKARPYIGALLRGTRDSLSDKELKTFQRVVRESTEDEIPEEQGVTILLLLPATGLRISEACKLRRCDVNRKHGALGLDILGKGDKVRRVPLNAFDDEAKKVLVEYDETVVRKGGSMAPLFPSPRNPERFISVSAVEGYLRRLRETHWADDDGGLATVECHTLRHTCATRLLRAKVPMHIVQKLLGHSSITTTERYAHPTDSDVVAALRMP